MLEPWCPVPFVAWPGPGLPGWAGALDLVIVLGPGGGNNLTASSVADAIRRGCSLITACPPRSILAEHAQGHGAPRPVVRCTELRVEEAAQQRTEFVAGANACLVDRGVVGFYSIGLQSLVPLFAVFEYQLVTI